MQTPMQNDNNHNKYTCNEYRDEMILASLQRRMQQADLTEEERRSLQEQIDRLERKMGL